MKKFAVHSAQAAAFAASMLAVPAVLAQDAPGATAAGLEEVTVTARRREETIQDVPIAVSAYSAERIETTGAPDITWLQETTPNLTLQVARGTNSTLIAFIRGIGQQDPLWGFEPGVGLYVDDVYIARPQGAVLDIYDVERLEVLRGPQGTLYGRNTIGGAVKYVTKPLGHDAYLDTKYTLGSYAQTDLLASGVLPLTDTLSVGASAAMYRHGGYGDNKFTGQHNAYEKEVDAYRASAEWTPGATVNVKLAADWVIDNSPAKHGHREIPGAGATTGEVVLPNEYDNRAGLGSDNLVRNQGVALTVGWDINDTLTFKSISAYRNGRTHTLIDFDASPQIGLDVPGRYADNQTTQEFQLLFQGDKLQGVAGLYYLDAMASGAFDTILGLANLTIATSGEVDTKSYAGFADVSYSFTDRLKASLGGRYTSDKRTGTVYRQNFTGIRSPLFGNDAAVPGLLRTDYTNDRTDDKFTPRASVSFDILPTLTTYASYSEGFKSGGFDMRGNAILTPDTVNGYDPESVKSYELGLKGSSFNGRVSYNLALFYSDYTDQQITRQEPTVSGGVASFVDNAGASTIQGVELEGAFGITDDLVLTYGVGYTDAEFDKYETYLLVGTTRQLVDLADVAHFQNTPEWNGNVSLAWNHRMAASRGSLSGSLTAAYRDKYYMFEFDRPLIDQTESYTLLDASLGWSSANDRFKVQLVGRNLTDERYKIGGYDFYTGQPAGTQVLFANTVNSFYAPPRTYSVSLSYRFD